MKILIAESENFSAEALEILKELGEVEVANLDRDGLLARVGSCDVLWIRLRNRIDEDVLASATNLKVIITPTTGLNHIDLAAAESRGIEVLSLKGETGFLRRIRATAEHTIGLTLALLRNLKPALEHVEGGGWNRDLFRGGEIQDKTVGVVGFGRLGQIVSKYFETFGARILITDPALPDTLSLHDLLAQSDIVSLHASLDETSEGFFDAEAFAAIREGAIFINTARGELIDEAALLESLKSGRLAGAAIDVLCNEDASGMADHPLVAYAKGHDQLLITPHIGGCTYESMERTEVFMAEKFGGST